MGRGSTSDRLCSNQSDAKRSATAKTPPVATAATARNSFFKSRRTRAQFVVDDLVRRGLDAARIQPVGKGELQPIASNRDEAGRSLNRRVEVECP